MAKIVLKEADAGPAIAFADRFFRALTGPDLLLTEVATAIVRSVNERTRSPTQGYQVLGDWIIAWRSQLVTSHRITSEDIAGAAGFAIELGHPLADCIYLTLAKRLKCDLVTCDAKFYAKAKPRHSCVRLLSEFGH